MSFERPNICAVKLRARSTSSSPITCWAVNSEADMKASFASAGVSGTIRARGAAMARRPSSALGDRWASRPQVDRDSGNALAVRPPAELSALVLVALVVAAVLLVVALVVA